MDDDATLDGRPASPVPSPRQIVVFHQALLAALLAVSLFAQGLPLSVCRCSHDGGDGAARTSAAESSVGPEKPHCPLCVESKRSSLASTVPQSDVADDSDRSDRCGVADDCCCSLTKVETSTVIVPSTEAPQKFSAIALPPTDPFAETVDVLDSGVSLDAVPQVPPAMPVRIWLCVWRN